jgi:hypothetical protein
VLRVRKDFGRRHNQSVSVIDSASRVEAIELDTETGAAGDNYVAVLQFGLVDTQSVYPRSICRAEIANAELVALAFDDEVDAGEMRIVGNAMIRPKRPPDLHDVLSAKAQRLAGGRSRVDGEDTTHGWKSVPAEGAMIVFFLRGASREQFRMCAYSSPNTRKTWTKLDTAL